MDTPENSIAEIHNSSFMASVEMISLDSKIINTFDIFNQANAKAIDESDYDLDKLKKYFEIELWVVNTKKGKDKFYINPFKKCELSDIKTTKLQK
jgi:deoxycytidine triphosphate deaminase